MERQFSLSTSRVFSQKYVSYDAKSKHFSQKVLKAHFSTKTMECKEFVLSSDLWPVCRKMTYGKTSPSSVRRRRFTRTTAFVGNLDNWLGETRFYELNDLID